MTSVEERLAAKGLSLPEAAAPIGSYVPYAGIGGMLFISGQLPFRDGQVITGTLGESMDVDEGAKAAEACALGIVAQVKTAVAGDFSRVTRVLKLEGFVASTPTFKDHPKVINGASDLMAELFGDKGIHSRAAVGVSALPLGAAVEVAAIVAIEEL